MTLGNMWALRHKECPRVGIQVYSTVEKQCKWNAWISVFVFVDFHREIVQKFNAFRVIIYLDNNGNFIGFLILQQRFAVNK